MSDEGATIIIILIVAIIALAIVGWLLYMAAGLVLAFTAFVSELPTIVVILMFIIFPPTFIVFLVGLAFIRFGVAERLLESVPEQSTVSKESTLSEIDRAAERNRRRSLGYDD